MASEMQSLKNNGVYELVDRPKGKKVVKSKWVLRVKKDSRGGVEKYKARVVAKGYGQVEGVDYDQTFSPTVRFESIRQMAALGASEEQEMHQMDVTTVFLYAPQEEVYMEQPEGTVRVGEGDATSEVPVWAETGSETMGHLYRRCAKIDGLQEAEK